jgi:glycosyltransferase involved in cell wall biosynthesis
MNILVLCSCWPNSREPNLGVFVRHRALAVSRQPGISMHVVAPVPWFPRLPDTPFIPRHWQTKANIPSQEIQEGLIVEHPRYLITPKVGMRHYGNWMARGVESLVRRLHTEKPFDLIDAHFIYPEGLAALRLGKMLNIPVVMTARGSDINLFSQIPDIRPLLVKALSEADGIIAVSEGLKKGITSLAVSGEKVKVIRNGINQQTFHLRDQTAARQYLGLPPDRKIIITVGYLTPRKGIHHLVEAMAVIRKNHPQTDVALYAIGEGNQRPDLETLIAQRGLQNHFFLPGAHSQTDLAQWYAAADFFCFASSGEGCPNVVVEALACGLPVIAADIPGVDELITHPGLGRLIPINASLAEGFATHISEALTIDWDRNFISTHGGARSWETVAHEVLTAFSDFRVIKTSIPRVA